MNDERNGTGCENSEPGRSAALYYSHDPSMAHLLLNFGIQVRDFIVVSFLADHGPQTIDQLARMTRVEPSGLLKCVKRLAAAGLVVREPVSLESGAESRVRLTSRGQDTASGVDRLL